MLLIESYPKFYSPKNHYSTRRVKYFGRSAILNMDREGFSNLGFYDKDVDEKPLDLVKKHLKFRSIDTGHIVWRYIYDMWRIPLIEIFYRKKILDKYGNEITPPV